MPSSFFAFQQGSDTRSLPPPDAESLRYGRFRVFHKNSVGNLFSAFSDDGDSERRESAGYGSINIATGIEGEEGDEGEGPDTRWWLDRKLVSPRRKVVQRTVGRWWTRWAVLVMLPAVISIVWCMIPFPTYPLPPTDDYSIYSAPTTPPAYAPNATVSIESSVWSHLGDAIRNVFDFSLLWDVIKSWFHGLRESVPAWPPAPGDSDGNPTPPPSTGGPGHGSSQVAMDFWFFLFVYYGFYNLIGLLWITKIFNMYSLNWWPPSLGFPPTFTFFNCLPLAFGAVMYYFLPGPIITQNLTWIFLTFATMCTPLLIAFLVLLFERRHRHLGVHRGLTETQLLFSAPSPARGRYLSSRSRSRRIRWPTGCFQLARSFRRFIWFCSALLLTLIGFVLGEAYAELYLRTLPHNSLETVIYVYSWVATIHTLDITTGYIIGAKVGSYPLGFVFKLYFSLIYQTYVRALYARLRSPSQFAYLQLLSSSIVIIWSPLSMTPTFHSILTYLGLSGQTWDEWRKNIGRSFYIRGIAENVSMVAWLGWVLVLHYGWNTKVYPYFSFRDEGGDGYTFALTFWASLATWGCEIVAGWVVRRVMRWGFGFGVTEEAVRDFVRFPELMPACIAVSVHVLQSMLFSIVRLRFY